MGFATEIFSKRLRELREIAELTQAQLANELKVSRGAISYYEKGERTPDIEFLTDVSELFSVSLEYLLGYTDNIEIEHCNLYETYGLTDTVLDKLEDWSKNEDERIKYYSGSVMYTHTFDLERMPADEVYID